METVISRRHPIQFYLITFAFFIGLLGCSVGVLYLAFTDNNRTSEKLLLGCGLSILFLIFSIYGLITYFINAPLIAISKKAISFNKKEYRIDDIVEIAYTGKQPFKYHPAFDLEGAKIVFSNGETKYILDKMYSNTSLLKMSLQSVYSNIPLSPPDLKKFDDTEPITYYKRNPLLSFNGIFLLGSIVMFTILCSLGPTVLIFLMFLTMFWSLILSFRTNSIILA